MNEISKRIKSITKKQHITQIQLAEYLNINQSSISNWYNSETIPSLENLIKIAKYCNVSLSWLLTGEAEKETALTEDEQYIIDTYRRAGEQKKKLYKSIIMLTDSDII